MEFSHKASHLTLEWKEKGNSFTFKKLTTFFQKRGVLLGVHKIFKRNSFATWSLHGLVHRQSIKDFLIYVPAISKLNESIQYCPKYPNILKPFLTLTICLWFMQASELSSTFLLIHLLNFFTHINLEKNFLFSSMMCQHVTPL